MAGQIPDKFVWTKMGFDAGETLENIVRRKELERRSGEGAFENVFWWGVGESRGEAIRKHLVDEVENPEILFSKMLSDSQQRDKKDGLSLIWRSYLDNEGNERPIPDHVIVHSRLTGSHRAIVCRSRRPLKLSRGNPFYKSELLNLKKDGTVGGVPGDSQTTSVVCYSQNSKGRIERQYHDDLRADLVDPYFVELACPRCLTETERALFRALFQCIDEDGKTILSTEDYLSVVGKLKNRTGS